MTAKVVLNPTSRDDNGRYRTGTLALVCLAVLFVLYIYLYSTGKTPTAEVYQQIHQFGDFGLGGITVNTPNIFFLETSGRSSLNAREGCAVESAARHHPNWKVRVLVVSTVLNISDPLMEAILKLPNVRFHFLDLPTLFNNTPVNALLTDGIIDKSRYKISHLSDACRFLLLYKYGGIYLDTDIVVLKSLDGLMNFAGKESADWVVCGVMGFERGHRLLKNCLQEMASHFSLNVWEANGPKLLTRVLLQTCGVYSVSEINSINCPDVKVLEPISFYPIYYLYWNDYFDLVNPSSVITQWNSSYLIHVWNKFSVNKQVRVGSGMPYDVAARDNCPYVYETTKERGTF